MYLCTVSSDRANLLVMHQASGLYHYKTYGVLEGVAPDVCAGVFMDHEYRRQWDTYVKGRVGEGVGEERRGGGGGRGRRGQ